MKREIKISPNPSLRKKEKIPLNLPFIKGEVLNLPRPLFNKEGNNRKLQKRGIIGNYRII